jgi:hypothetical protein
MTHALFVSCDKRDVSLIRSKKDSAKRPVSHSRASDIKFSLFPITSLSLTQHAPPTVFKNDNARASDKRDVSLMTAESLKNNNMNDERKALYQRFGISEPTMPTTWLDLDPAERRRLWQRAMRKANYASANRSKGPKPALLWPVLYE